MNGGKCAHVSQHFAALGWSLSLGCFGRMFYLIKTIYIRYERASVETHNPTGAYDRHDVEERRNVSPFQNGIPSFILTLNLNLIAEYTRSEYRQDRHKVQHKNLN